LSSDNLTLDNLQGAERLRILFYKNDIDLYRTQLVVGSFNVAKFLTEFSYEKREYIIRSKTEINIYI